MANPDSPLQKAARRLEATPGQVALAWLLKKSPVMLPIPGTSRVEHLESNLRAALLELDVELAQELEASVVTKRTPPPRKSARRPAFNSQSIQSDADNESCPGISSRWTSA